MRSYKRQRAVKAMQAKVIIGEAKKIKRQLEKLDRRMGGPTPLNSGDLPAMRNLYTRIGRLMNALQNVEFGHSKPARVLRQASLARRFLGGAFSTLSAGNSERASIHLNQALYYQNTVVIDLTTELKNPRNISRTIEY